MTIAASSSGVRHGSHRRRKWGNRKSVAVFSVVGVIGCMVAQQGAARAATISVTTANDDNGGTATTCSLREAIADINGGKKPAVADGCTVSGTFGVADTIKIGVLKVVLSQALGGVLVTRSMTIQGAGYAKSVIDGAKVDIHSKEPRAMLVIGDDTARPAVSVTGLTIQGTHTTAPKASGVSGVSVGKGAFGDLSYVKILDTGSDPVGEGGCVRNAGVLEVDRSELRGCRGQLGGGIFSQSDTGSLGVNRTTIHQCRASTAGAIFTDDDTSITSSTIANNEATSGTAGIDLDEGASGFVSGVTIVGNFTTAAGVVGDPVSALLLNRPVATNVVQIQGNIVAFNKAPNSVENRPNCGAVDNSTPTNTMDDWSFTSLGGNMLGDPGDDFCPGQFSIEQFFDPGIITGPSFTFSDGKTTAPTPTAAGGVGPVYRLKAGSPSKGKVQASDSFCVGGVDQRGISRAGFGADCDIGAAVRSPALVVLASGRANISASDQKIIGTLTNLGFDVTTIVDNKVTAANTSDKAIVVISESVASGNVNFKLRDVPAGVLVLEWNLFDDMKMTGTTANTNFGLTANAQTNVTMIQDSVLGLLVGDLGTGNPPNIGVTTAGQTFGWGVPQGPFAKSEAMIAGDGTKRAIFSYSAGESMAGGFVAPGARVGFFATEAAVNVLTATGRRLLEEAILRAAEGGGSGD